MPDKVGKLEGLIRPIRPSEILKSPRTKLARIPAAKTAKYGLYTRIKTQASRDTRQTAESSRSGGIQQTPEDLSAKESRHLMETLNELFKVFNVEAHYFIDPGTEIQTVQLRDIETQELIRQIPSEEFLITVSRTRDIIGLLFDTKV